MTNLYARWRLPAFDLLRVRYLTAGLFYLVITAAFILIFFLIVRWVGAAKVLVENRVAKRAAIAAFEAGGDHEKLRQELLLHRKQTRPFFLQLYIVGAVTALFGFPICILFFTPPQRSRYVLWFFLGMYGGGLVFMSVLRLVQQSLQGSSQPNIRRERVFDGCRYTIIALMWFFGIDVLVALHVPDKLALVGPFYGIFTLLLGLQVLFVIEPHLRATVLAQFGSAVFWTTIPCALFIVSYLSMVAFALQVYTTIPASRGGGDPPCIDVEVAESPAAYEVAQGNVRTYRWHERVIMLDDRADVMYVARQIEKDGSVHELKAFDRPLVRGIFHYDEDGNVVNFLDGWRRLLSGSFWRSFAHDLVSVRDFHKDCFGAPGQRATWIVR